MKGIITAGGTGSRLYPLTKVTNKHLLPVYDRPMVFYPIQTLLNAGIEDILIVCGKGHAGDFLELLSDGSAFFESVQRLDGPDAWQGKRLRLSYIVQEQAGGIAQAIALAKDFAERARVAVILGDNIIEDSIAPGVESFKRQKSGAKIFLKEVENPSHYGIADVTGDRIERIIEKPSVPSSRLAVAGIYLYDDQVWDILRNVKPSARGELEITDVNNTYIARGQMKFERLHGWWGDGGESFDSLLEAGRLIAQSKGLATAR